MAKKILIIDDDMDFAEACKNCLEASGFQVDWEPREDQAMNKIREFKPDLIFLDIKMQTETAGFDIADKIQEDEQLRMIPIAFLTGYFQREALKSKEHEIIQKWKNVKGVLDKPIKPAVLIEIVRSV